MPYVSTARTLVAANVALFAVATIGCQDNRARDAKISDLERRVTALETESKQQAESEKSRSSALMTCLAQADVAYQENLRRNSHKSGNGYSAALYIVQAAQSEKREAIEECKLLYGGK